jgi:hypothetical protein
LDSMDWAEVGRTHLCFVDLARRRKALSGCNDGSSNESSHVTCDTLRTGVPTGKSVGGVPRGSSTRRGASRKGARCEGQLASQPLPLGSGECASACRTARRNAFSSCSIRPYPPARVGAWFSRVGLAGVGEQPMLGAGSCRLAIGPEQGGARENDNGRERSVSIERGSSSYGAGGRHRSPKLHRCERSCNTLRGTVPR